MGKTKPSARAARAAPVTLKHDLKPLPDARIASAIAALIREYDIRCEAGRTSLMVRLECHFPEIDFNSASAADIGRLRGVGLVK